MKCSSFLLFAVSCFGATLAQADDHPVSKVIQLLEDKIASLEEQEQVLTDQIKELADQLLELDAASKKAYHQRRITANLFKEAETDYDSTIQAIKDALKAMEDSYKATEPAPIQSSAKLMSAVTRGKL